MATKSKSNKVADISKKRAQKSKKKAAKKIKTNREEASKSSKEMSEEELVEALQSKRKHKVEAFLKEYEDLCRKHGMGLQPNQVTMSVVPIPQEVEGGENEED